LQGEQTVAWSSGTADQTIFIPFDASFGGQVGIGLTLYSSATCVTFNNTTCSSDTNFINTLTVLGVSVVDANGNVVPGATITADSGTNYNDITGDNVSPSAGTPEPSSVLMLGVSMLALAELVLKKSS
jgi:hypothetical protein